jgi:adenine phosphoribosyltransferase
MLSGCSFIIDLPQLGGKEKIEGKGIEVQALCSFEGH